MSREEVADLDLVGDPEEGVEEEEEGETDVSSVGNLVISPENVQWVEEEDLELGLERASATTVVKSDTLLESAVVPGEEGSPECNFEKYQNMENNVSNCQCLNF